jgi:uncharacterized membrane protein YidH (DUF202 family)
VTDPRISESLNFEQDRGLAIERTALSWTRSALAVAVIAVLAIRRGVQGDLPALAYTLGVLLFVAALAVWMYGASVFRRRSAGAADPAPRTLAFKVMSTGTVVIAAVAVVLAIPS